MRSRFSGAESSFVISYKVGFGLANYNIRRAYFFTGRTAERSTDRRVDTRSVDGRMG
jgi:hypothetical protein